MKMPKFHKLYFPGLISLVFLPLMCIWYFMSQDVFHKYGIMEVAWMPKSDLNKYVSSYGKKFNVETFRKYERITLSGNLDKDDVSLNNLKRLLIQLSAKNDTLNGIKVSFGKHATYEELVNVLDICYQKDKDDLFMIAPTGAELFIAYDGLPTGTIHPK